MSNSMRGAIPFEVDGKELAIALTTNAMVRYQDRAEETLLAGLSRLQADPSDIRRIRRMFWAGMSHVEGMTEDLAGDIMDAFGIMDAVKLLSQAAAAAFPDVKDAPGNVQRAVKGPKTATR